MALLPQQLGAAYSPARVERFNAPRRRNFRALELTGLEFARQELRTNDQLIASAEALLMGSDPDFVSAFVAALRTFAGALDRSRTGRTD